MQTKGIVTYFSVPYANFEKDKQLRDCLFNRQIFHKEIQKMFGTSREESDVLYRVEQTKEGFVIVIKSNIVPNVSFSNLFSKYEKTSSTCDISKYYEGLKKGTPIKFKLEAFPYYSFFKEGRKNPIKRVLTNAEKRREWLEKKLSESGLELIRLTLDEDKGQKMVGKGGNSVGFFKTYDFRGFAVVKDENLLSKALEKGIGPEKAYGAGLLVLY